MPATPPPHVPGLTDAHCHLDYPPMADDVAGTLDRARRAGVEQVVQVGCSLQRMQPAIELARQHPEVFAVVGIHPHEASSADEEGMDRVATASKAPKVVAIGETGLDYHYDRSPRPAQRQGLRHHAELASTCGLPLVLHIRDAHGEALELMAASPLPDPPGMVHCFTGGPDEARAWLDLGFHLSFSGITTFRKAAPIREAARLCPLDRLLLETDAPYLAPVPNRGRKNEPANVAFTCVDIAGLRGMTPEALAEASTSNLRGLLGLPRPASSAPSSAPPA